MENLYLIFLLFCSAIFAVSSDVDLSTKVPDFYKLIIVLFSTNNMEILSTQIEDEKDVVIKKDVPYEDKFKVALRDMTDEMIVAKDKKWDNTFIMECTPIGNVIMTYDAPRETFVYYSDNIIPFRFLDVVSRKFALHFHCKHLVVDVELEEQKMIDDSMKSEEKNNADMLIPVVSETQSEPPTDKKPKDVFAKFKTYNQQQSGPSASGAKEQTRISSKKSRPVVEKSNRYSCQGKLANFDIMNQTSVKPTDLGKLKFSDFKNLPEYKKSLL